MALLFLIIIGLIIWGLVAWWRFLGLCFAKMADKVGLTNDRSLAWIPIARHYLFGKISGLPALGIIYVIIDIPKWIISIVKAVNPVIKSDQTFALIDTVITAVLMVLGLVILFFIAKRFKAYVEFAVIVVIELISVFISQILGMQMIGKEAINPNILGMMLAGTLTGTIVLILLELWMYKLMSDKNPDGYVPEAIKPLPIEKNIKEKVDEEAMEDPERLQELQNDLGIK